MFTWRTIRPSLSAVLAAALGTALICLVGLTQAAVDQSLQQAGQRSIAGAAVVVAAGRDPEIITTTQADQVAKTEGVSGVAGQLSGIVTAPDLNEVALNAQSLPAPDQLVVDQGRLPVASDEAVLAQVAAKPINLTIGTRLRIVGAGGASHELTVVGFVSGPLGSFDNPALPSLLGTSPSVQTWTGLNGFTRLLVFSSRSATRVADSLANLSALDGLTLETGAAYAARHASDFAPGAPTLTMAMQLLVAVTIIAALVVITNTFSIKAAQRARELALLRCLGASRHQVFWTMLAEGVATGLLGAVVGIGVANGVGLLLLAHLPGGLSLSYLPSIPATLLALGAGVSITALSALRPAVRATRIRPLAALRAEAASAGAGTGRLRSALGLAAAFGGLGIVAAGGVLHEVLIAFAGAILSLAGLVAAAPSLFPTLAGGLAKGFGTQATTAAAGLRRNPRRMGATAVAVWFSTTLVSAVIVGAATASATMSSALDEGTPVDVIATTRDAAELAPRLARAPQVAATALVRSVMVDTTMAGQDRILTVVGWNRSLPGVLGDGVPRPAAGTIQLPPEAGVPDGSPLTLTSGGRDLTLRVANVDGAPSLGVVNAADMSGPRLDERPGIWIKLRPGVNEQATLSYLSSIAGPGTTLTSQAVLRSQLQETLDTATISAVALLSVIILIALVGLANTLSLSVIERTREIGLLRALGALRRQIQQLIATEALLTTVVATAIGIGFGVVYGLGGVGAVLSGEQLVVVPAVPWLLLGVVAAGTTEANRAHGTLPARRASSVTPIAALAVPGE